MNATSGQFFEELNAFGGDECAAESLDTGGTDLAVLAFTFVSYVKLTVALNPRASNRKVLEGIPERIQIWRLAFDECLTFTDEDDKYSGMGAEDVTARLREWASLWGRWIQCDEVVFHDIDAKTGITSSGDDACRSALPLTQSRQHGGRLRFRFVGAAPALGFGYRLGFVR